MMACTPSQPPPESLSESPGADLIVEGDYVVTMDENQEVIKGGAVAIKDGLIIAIDSAGGCDGVRDIQTLLTYDSL